MPALDVSCDGLMTDGGTIRIKPRDWPRDGLRAGYVGPCGTPAGGGSGNGIRQIRIQVNRSRRLKLWPHNTPQLQSPIRTSTAVTTRITASCKVVLASVMPL
jgi:hypothetical protein